MSGFTLIGPSFTIRSIAGAHCWGGFSGTIPAHVEDILVNQENKTLDIAVLPADIQSNILKTHHGNNFSYAVVTDEMPWRTEMSQRMQKLRDNINEMLEDLNMENAEMFN